MVGAVVIEPTTLKYFRVASSGVDISLRIHDRQARRVLLASRSSLCAPPCAHFCPNFASRSRLATRFCKFRDGT